jgi:hypothetical protein
MIRGWLWCVMVFSIGRDKKNILWGGYKVTA